MFDQIDDREYNDAWAFEDDFEAWVEEHSAWVAMMEDSARIRVNVELREIAAEQQEEF